MPGVDIDRDGDLVATIQGADLRPYQAGIPTPGWNSGVRRVRIDNARRSPKVGPYGRIHAPIAKVLRHGKAVAGTPLKATREDGAMFQQGIYILGPDGSEVRRYWHGRSGAGI